MTGGDIGRRLALLAGRATPATLTALLVLPSILPIESVALGQIAPMLTVMAVFYWSIYRPELLPSWVAFLIGLMQDLLSGGPVGLTPLVLVLISTYVATQRRIFLARTFMVGWWGFALVTLAVAALSWIVASLYLGAPMRPMPILAQAAVTVVLYPPLVWLLGRAQGALMRQV